MMLRSWTIFSVVALSITTAAYASEDKAAHPSEKQCVALDGDYVLPYYLNLSKATLVLWPTNTAQERGDLLEVEVSIFKRDSDALVIPQLRFSIASNHEHRQVIDIAAWPDGDYKTAIRCFIQGKELGEPQIRWLRKQTIASPSAPQEPIDVQGISTLFVDDWYIASSQGMEHKIQPAETFAVTTGRLDPDYPVQMPQGGIGLESDGTWVVRFTARPRFGLSAPKKQYIARSKDDCKTWTIEEEKQDSPQNHTQRTPASNGDRRPKFTLVSQSKTSDDKTTYRFYDAAKDGPINLRGVEVKHTGVADTEQTKWGEITLPIRTAFPIWKKTPTEVFILAKSASDWLTQDYHLHADGDPGDWKDTNDNFMPFESYKGDGKRAFFGQSRLVLRYGDFRVPYDIFDHFRGGAYNRAMLVWHTADGLNWTPTYFDPIKESDPPSLQGYGGNQFYAEGNRLSMCYYYAYHGFDQQVPVEIRFSRDNIYWQRLSDTDSENIFAANGPWKSWNFGYMHQIMGSAVEKNGVMYQLFASAQNIPHHFYRAVLDWDPKSASDPDRLQQYFKDNEIPRYKHWQDMGGTWEGFAKEAATAARPVGGMRYRTNGWVKYLPTDGRGEFTSRILTAGSTVTINAQTKPGGTIRVEVLDQEGMPLDDYCGDNAALFQGNAIQGQLSWKNGGRKTLPAGPFRLHFIVKDAELFALNWK